MTVSYVVRVGVGVGGGSAATNPNPWKNPRMPCHFDQRETTK